jgi:hypothetical protein
VHKQKFGIKADKEDHKKNFQCHSAQVLESEKDHRGDFLKSLCGHTVMLKQDRCLSTTCQIIPRRTTASHASYMDQGAHPRSLTTCREVHVQGRIFEDIGRRRLVSPEEPSQDFFQVSRTVIHSSASLTVNAPEREVLVLLFSSKIHPHTPVIIVAIWFPKLTAQLSFNFIIVR